MKTIAQFPKIISVLMIFILMIEFTGCYSTRILTTSEISSSEIYLIHSNNSTYPVDSVVISEGVLSGKREAGITDKNKKGTNHIYLSSGSGIKIDNDILSVPVQSITKVEQRTIDPKKTGILTAVLIVGGIGFVVLTTVLIVNLVNEAAETTADVANSTIQVCSTY
jgi:hypothetical protein